MAVAATTKNLIAISANNSDWQAKKSNHLALANTIAQNYDSSYGQANFATSAYMRYELELLQKVLVQCPNRKIAIDLGCGTGRISFVLAEHFQEVHAYDFSPEMIEVAHHNQQARKVSNIRFEVRDIEAGPLPFAANSITFINSAFGMGSFVQHLKDLLNEAERVLEPGGFATFSFYNAAALSRNLPNLSTQAAQIINDQTLLVKSGCNNSSYRIAAQSYSPREVAEIVAESGLQLLTLITYPTVAQIISQSIFDRNSQIRELCLQLDALLAETGDMTAGTYIIAICQKEEGNNNAHNH